MKRTWTIIGVRDVPWSFKWYRSLFGQRPTLLRQMLRVLLGVPTETTSPPGSRAAAV